MVAGDVGDPRPLAGLAQKFLDDVVMLLRPVPAALQLPELPKPCTSPEYTAPIPNAPNTTAGSAPSADSAGDCDGSFPDHPNR